MDNGARNDPPAVERTAKSEAGGAGAPGRRTGRRRFVAGVFTGVVLVFAVRFAINETSVADALVAPLLLEDTAGTADAIVVMGAGVTGECSPNQNGVWRVLRGAREWRNGRAPIVAFTGGQGDVGCPIAVAMSRLAQDIGVPADRIVVETRSRSTRENAVFIAPLLRGRGVRCVLVVTDKLHMPRAASSFTGQGFGVARASVPVYEGHRDNVSMLYEGGREGLALAYYRLRGWLGAPDQPCTPPAAGPAATDTMPQDAARVNVTNPTGPLVVFGASYAGGWTPERLGGVPLVNRGVGGETSSQMRARFERDLLAAGPRAVIIWGFINDIFRAPDQADTVKTIRDNYTAMIDTARRIGIEPIVATEVTMRARETGWRETAAAWVGWLRGKEGYAERVNRQVIDTNRWLLDQARRERILLLDIQGTLGDADGVRRREFVQDDGSHITAAGYAAATAYAAPILDGHFGRRTP